VEPWIIEHAAGVLYARRAAALPSLLIGLARACQFQGSFLFFFPPVCVSMSVAMGALFRFQVEI
jgi:hypothetical protein